MKTISTFVTLMLIVVPCATSAVLFLNENYGISAALCITWIIALTMWIGKASGIFNLLIQSKQVAQNA